MALGLNKLLSPVLGAFDREDNYHLDRGHYLVYQGVVPIVYITGDTHADLDIGKLSTSRFPEQKQLTKNDYVIVCGDFGLCWDASTREKWWQKWLSERNFTTLWVDGNHENFDMLYDIPIKHEFGAEVREVAPSIYHIERGQVIELDGKKFFCMGGARSHDRHHRKEHVSWWAEEMPSSQEMEHAIQALDANGWKVDYVVTHCAPRSVQTKIAEWYENDPMVSFLEWVKSDLSFEKWFFGHYHIDREIDEKFTALYNKVIQI